MPGLLGYDRQGRPRLRLTDWGVPHRWHLRAGEGQKPNWSPLGRGLPAPDTDAFDISTQGFFAQRSFPLGFDEDPNLLYIASNTGRLVNTVGPASMATPPTTS